MVLVVDNGGGLTINGDGYRRRSRCVWSPERDMQRRRGNEREVT